MSNDGYTISANWRSLGAVDHLTGSSRGISTESYLDLTGRYQFAEGMTFSVGVNNILANDPPYLTGANGSNGNTYPGYFDALGRYVFASISYEFM